MAGVFTTSGSGLLGQTNGLANKAITSSPLTAGGNSNIASGLSVNPLTGNVGQGSPASLAAGTLGGGYPANVSTANSLLGPLDTSSQEVKKVVSSPDGTQEVHLYPSTSSQNATSNSNSSYNPNAGYNAGITPITPPAGTPVQTPSTGASTQPQAPFSQATTGLLNAPGANNIISQQARDIQALYAPQMAAITKGIVGQQTGDLTTGTAPVGEGNAAIAAQAGGQELQGLSQAEQAALNTLTPQLTAQQQAQSALGTAGQLTQPSGNYPFVFNPSTGQFTSGAAGSGSVGLTLTPSTDISNAVKAIQSDPTLYNSYAQAITSGYGANGSVIKGQLDAALLSQGLNPTNLSAQGTGVAQGIGQAGVNAGTAAQAIGKAQPVAQNLDALIQSNNINPYNITYANGAVNFLKSNFGTPQQQTAMTEFSGQLNDLASTLAPILGIPGGATTDFKTSLGQSIVNGLQNGQSVQQSINYFISQAQQGAAGAYSGGTNPIQTINTPTNSSQSVTLGSGTQAHYVNGKWVLGNQ